MIKRLGYNTEISSNDIGGSGNYRGGGRASGGGKGVFAEVDRRDIRQVNDVFVGTLAELAGASLAPGVSIFGAWRDGMERKP